MNTDNLIRILNDKYTWIGYGDGEVLTELFLEATKQNILEATSHTTYNNIGKFEPLRHRILVRPIDKAKQWCIHISYGHLKDVDIAKLKEIGDIEGLCDEVIYERNFHKIRVNTNPNMADGDEVYLMALDIIADYFKATHTTEIDIAMDFRVDVLNNTTIVDNNSKPKKYGERRNKIGGEIETMYFGDKSSYEEICMYNKKLERKVKGKPLVGYTELDEDMYRVEVRFHGKESNVNFHNGKNPFENIKIYPKEMPKIKLSYLKTKFRHDMAKNLFDYINLINVNDTEELKAMFSKRSLVRYKQIYESLLEELNEEVIDLAEIYEKHKSQFIKESASYFSKFTGNKLEYSKFNR